MNMFIKENFTDSGEYPHYEGKFVARFKHGGKADFKKFLIKNFTPEEYFGYIGKQFTPLDVLKLKGYISPNVRKVLKSQGYPETLEGQLQYINDVAKKHMSNA